LLFGEGVGGGVTHPSRSAKLSRRCHRIGDDCSASAGEETAVPDLRP